MKTFAKYPFLEAAGLAELNEGAFYNGKWQTTNSAVTLDSVNPADGEVIASTKAASLEDYDKAIEAMKVAQREWAVIPMPKRGDIVRQIGEALRGHKKTIGNIISLEMGKIESEGLGEVQQTIDICDMACGLSRTIGGSVFNSERPDHFMMEVWNPLGIVAVITAFNFPNAVFGWNAAIALVTGNAVVWKGAPSSSLSTIATAKVINRVLEKNGINPNIFTVVQGGNDIAEALANDARIPLVSFTGSTYVGGLIRQKVESRFGRCLLELGGNNCTIIMDDANLEMAFKGCTFAAVGTAGQRCTSLRRLLIHEKHYDYFVEKMVKAYSTVKIGDPLDPNTLMGPVNSQRSIDLYKGALERAQKEGGKILCGGKQVDRKGFFVEPTIVEAPKNAPFLQDQFFCPILFVQKFSTLEEAIQINNNTKYGLSSALFTNNLANAYKWVGPHGSDCGIVNVNIGNSGAEIGGAFGGQKYTGGGRQAGSDAWKQYMRRATCTINHGSALPLAQGVNFDL